MLQQKWEAKKRRKIRLNQVSNSQPQGHESDMLTTELPRRAWKHLAINVVFLKVVYLKMKNYDGGNVSNPFSSDKFHSSKLEEFGDDNSKFDENSRKFIKGEENTVGKGEIALTSNFSFSPRFSKDLYCSHGLVWEAVKYVTD